MKLTLLLLSLFVTVTLSQKTIITIFRSYNLQNIQQPNNQKVAEILYEKKDKTSVDIELTNGNIIESSVFENINDSATLSFIGDNINMKYTIKYSDVLQTNYKQIINIIANNNQQIVSFNYFQEKLKKKQGQQTLIHLIKPEQSKEHVFAYTMQPAKPKEAEQEQQSFFSKYKWYLIGFGAVVYLMSNVDPQKAAQMAQKK